MYILGYKVLCEYLEPVLTHLEKQLALATTKGFVYYLMSSMVANLPYHFDIPPDDPSGGKPHLSNAMPYVEELCYMFDKGYLLAIAAQDQATRTEAEWRTLMEEYVLDLAMVERMIKEFREDR